MKDFFTKLLSRLSDFATVSKPSVERNTPRRSRVYICWAIVDPEKTFTGRRSPQYTSAYAAAK